LSTAAPEVRRQSVAKRAAPWVYALDILLVEATLISRGHLLAGVILDACVALVAMQWSPNRDAQGSPSATAARATQALAIVAFSRVMALGLPLGRGTQAGATLVVALLVGFTVLRSAAPLGIRLRDALRPQRPWLQASVAIAGLGLGAVATLAEAPRLTSPPALAFGVLAVVVAVIVEELLFRGLVQITLQRVSPRAGPWVANALFAATYLGYGPPALVATVAGAGLVFAYAVARTGSVLGAVGGHVLFAVGALWLWPLVGVGG